MPRSIPTSAAATALLCLLACGCGAPRTTDAPARGDVRAFPLPPGVLLDAAAAAALGRADLPGETRREILEGARRIRPGLWAVDAGSLRWLLKQAAARRRERAEE